jgi:hypothetical protein
VADINKVVEKIKKKCSAGVLEKFLTIAQFSQLIDGLTDLYQQLLELPDDDNLDEFEIPSDDEEEDEEDDGDDKNEKTGKSGESVAGAGVPKVKLTKE